jgi:hypothetical protein
MTRTEKQTMLIYFTVFLISAYNVKPITLVEAIKFCLVLLVLK